MVEVDVASLIPPGWGNNETEQGVVSPHENAISAHAASAIELAGRIYNQVLAVPGAEQDGADVYFSPASIAALRSIGEDEAGRYNSFLFLDSPPKDEVLAHLIEVLDKLKAARDAARKLYWHNWVIGLTAVPSLGWIIAATTERHIHGLEIAIDKTRNTPWPRRKIGDPA